MVVPICIMVGLWDQITYDYRVICRLAVDCKVN